MNTGFSYFNVKLFGMPKMRWVKRVLVLSLLSKIAHHTTTPSLSVPLIPKSCVQNEISEIYFFMCICSIHVYSCILSPLIFGRNWNKGLAPLLADPTVSRGTTSIHVPAHGLGSYCGTLHADLKLFRMRFIMLGDLIATTTTTTIHVRVQ